MATKVEDKEPPTKKICFSYHKLETSMRCKDAELVKIPKLEWEDYENKINGIFARAKADISLETMAFKKHCIPIVELNPNVKVDSNVNEAF